MAFSAELGTSRLSKVQCSKKLIRSSKLQNITRWKIQGSWKTRIR